MGSEIPTPPQQKRVVRIPLECFLVNVENTITLGFGSSFVGLFEKGMTTFACDSIHSDPRTLGTSTAERTVCISTDVGTSSIVRVAFIDVYEKHIDLLCENQKSRNLLTNLESKGLNSNYSRYFFWI